MATNRDWQAAREAVGDIARVLALARGSCPPSRTARGLSYLLARGDRRGKSKSSKNSVTGERVIEGELIGTSLEIAGAGPRPLARVEVIGSAMPLGASRALQREVDLWGVDEEGGPVAIEVKDTDADPWYALVELCEYVWRMRHDPRGLELSVQRALQDERRHRGAWGLLLAPRRWWDKSAGQPSRRAHEDLIDALAEETKLRLCSVVYLTGERRALCVAGRPPR